MNIVLGLDHGDRRIGIAVSDPLEIIAKPLKTIDLLETRDVFNDINLIVVEYSIYKIIVGLPKTLKGEFSKQTIKVMKFVELLKKNVEVEVDVYDERLTSKIAKESLIFQGIKTGHNKSDVDMTAAAVFLQNYLDDVKK